MKFLSKAWKAMTEEQKDRYKQISDQDRSRFDEERRELKCGKYQHLTWSALVKTDAPKSTPENGLLGKRSREMMKQVNYAPFS
jgi:hypothetical protein